MYFVYDLIDFECLMTLNPDSMAKVDRHWANSVLHEANGFVWLWWQAECQNLS